MYTDRAHSLILHLYRFRYETRNAGSPKPPTRPSSLLPLRAIMLMRFDFHSILRLQFNPLGVSPRDLFLVPRIILRPANALLTRVTTLSSSSNLKEKTRKERQKEKKKKKEKPFPDIYERADEEEDRRQGITLRVINPSPSMEIIDSSVRMHNAISWI